jgi:CDP-glucose 4,6-dehydratase
MVATPELSHINTTGGPILIIGHTGFKGTWLTMLLEHLEVEVAGLSLPAEAGSLFERAGRMGKIQEKYLDITDENAINQFIKNLKPKVIIHLAAQSLVLESYKKPKYTFEVNVTGLMNVLDAAINSESTKAVLVSTTDKVYDSNLLKMPFKESDPLRGKDPYSASKVAGENVIYAWRELAKKTNNLKILTARSGNVIGGGDFSKDRLIPDIIRAFSTNSDLLVRSLASTRPWQHVLDPLMGYLKMINSALKGTDLEALNFGPSEKSLSVREVIETAVDFWPSNSKIIEVNSSYGLEAISLELDSTLSSRTLGWKSVWAQREAVVASLSWWKDVLSQEFDAQARCNLDITEFLKAGTKW